MVPIVDGLGFRSKAQNYKATPHKLDQETHSQTTKGMPKNHAKPTTKTDCSMTQQVREKCIATEKKSSAQTLAKVSIEKRNKGCTKEPGQLWVTKE